MDGYPVELVISHGAHFLGVLTFGWAFLVGRDCLPRYSQFKTGIKEEGAIR